MPLTILSSNRVETLQSGLAQLLTANPPRDPFTPEVVVVPTYAMSRWLNLRFARGQGIAANIHYPQAGEWIWQLAASLLDDAPQRDPYSGEALTWPVFALLPSLVEEDAFRDLREYLADDQSSIKRWQLAQRIAGVFERYQLYRPQLVQAWSAGEEHHWQAKLWRVLLSHTEQPHRAELITRAIERLGATQPAAVLPERINLFAISSLAPIFIEFIHALATKTHVLMFQHNPTDQYWADLVSEKTRARQRLLNPDHVSYLETGNDLLSSWGRQGQAMQDLLLDLGPVIDTENEHNHAPGDDSLLRALQQGLFSLSPPRIGARADDSLSVHVCHSPMRECQVLHDYLLDLLDRNPGLCCEDILVMAPEISHYAPFIEAVFQHDDSGHRPSLAWNLSDISVGDSHPLTRTFLQLLRLPGSRFTRSEILACLECTELRDRFGISGPMIEDIHRMIDSARVHWGIDAGQRHELGLPAIHENTWSQAWDRFFTSYALGDDELWRGIAPAGEVDTDSGIAIARLRNLFERLVYWRREIASPASAAGWQRRLTRLLEEFLAEPGAIDDRLQPLRNAINELGDSQGGELDQALVTYWMEQRFASTQQSGRLYSGGVTFCGMQPMRNIPFPVICVIGMHDQAFPRRGRTAGFDLMSRDWRPGDPHGGDQDRYLMLETLLCARSYLYFSYCGRSLRDNSECQPSVLLRQLLDHIDKHADTGADLCRQIVREHPMQAFSTHNFQQGSPGYDQYWFDTAMHLRRAEAKKTTPCWAVEKLLPPSEPMRSIELQMLLQFFRHPIRYFFNHRLGIRIPAEQQSDDEERFTLNALQKWELAQQLASSHVRGEPTDFERFSAEGLLPHGEAAAAEWDTLQVEFRDLLDRLEPFRNLQVVPRRVEYRLDNGLLLSGEVDQCYPGLGLMRFSPSKSLKGRGLIDLWLNHLTLCAAGSLTQQECSQLLGPTGIQLRYAALESSVAKSLLRSYVDLFSRGLDYPLLVFPNTSYAWASKQDGDAALSAAQSKWCGDNHREASPGEREDDFIKLALHNYAADPLDDPLFQEYAHRIYLPAIEHGDQDA